MSPWPKSPASSKKPEPLSDAEFATGVLTFLAEEPERLARFFDLTGLTPDGLRRASTEPGFAGALLDHLRSDERLLTAFASAQQMNVAELETLHRRLAGAAEGDFP